VAAGCNPFGCQKNNDAALYRVHHAQQLLCGVTSMKIPKRLIHEFEQVIFGKDIDADIHDLEDVINFAAKWCDRHRLPFNMERTPDDSWMVHIYHKSHDSTNLSRAIMEAVVSAAKQTKEAGR
jgi:hypothetical protein